ncbi:lysM domain receptor-like kinase 3 isoform X2 [Medicago truncatula]|uniref:LysM domain-containing receptor-like kinase 4 n=2 Tax=Medicago truncatula TaxID=3880 RepID=Q6UD76_MEDTR|nr:lysM domain receptor-like kinase 3 isoform X2 [Medicago truncatula]AAQ73156.1 LysM domain-containing receptor-like kinase 4 [Medicago truncatula]
MNLKNGLLLFILFLDCVFFKVETKCVKGCDVALASYYIMPSIQLINVSNFIQSKIVLTNSFDVIMSYNRVVVFDKSGLISYTRINVPFPCECIGGEFLGHVFEYTTKEGDDYDLIANTYYASLTTVELLKKFNSYDPNHIPVKAKINVTVICSCGNSQISKDFGLFVTYPLRSDDTLAKIATKADLDEGLLQNFNQDANFSKGSGIVFIPGRDENGVYVPLPSRKAGHLARSLVAAGICIRGVCMVLLLAICIYVRYFRKKNGEESKLPPEDSMSPSTKDGDKDSYSDTRSKYILVDKSPKFSYKVLANATENFSLAKKIGQGGFGEVYYGVLGGKKVAIKKMKTQATREFLSELKVLTSVRHLNLVHLIGYCVEGFLFLVYEYMENGNLSQHLHNSEKELMTLSRRMKIALDVARGLEYIHDHSVPVYIHRDIKSDNILLNKNFNGKIADFGLTKLTNIANSTDNTNHMAGTFGYMPPENAYGRISRKMDVYAFGVVLYELISAKAAVIMIDKNEFESHEIKTNESTDEYKSLVALFDEVMDQKGDPIEGLRKLVDPRLGDNYSIDSISKMAKLAKACINRDPKQRPKMRDVVVSLMKLISTIDDESRTDSAELSLDVEHDSN